VDPHTIPGAKDFVARYEARYGEIGSFSAYGYDAANVLIEAVRRAGKKDRESGCSPSQKMKDYPGILGRSILTKEGGRDRKSVGSSRWKRASSSS